MPQQDLAPSSTAGPAARPLARVAEQAADQALQAAADASVWLLFRISRVRS
ncbi:hypothetical protein [Nocardioides dongxiaopingii]|uniref:hypothetical protein n=1 Tax=Nocardioides sp. S-1144 TaxID=2582905 RepID=UPI001651D2E2|nr:hypothetical protein [Nocardioides sp. S-1144]